MKIFPAENRISLKKSSKLINGEIEIAAGRGGVGKNPEIINRKRGTIIRYSRI